MKSQQNHEKFLKLREQFPFMVFQSYHFSLDDDAIRVKFNFNLADKYVFQPSLTIPYRTCYDWKSVPSALIENLIFHIGMVEAISYWKTACSPVFIVDAAPLSMEQTAFWKKIYFHGLGEFFYLNGIHTNMDDFMDIRPKSDKPAIKQSTPVKEKVLIPVGGGKDSVVSLELLRHHKTVIPVILNPRGASSACAEVAGFSIDETAIVYRQLDEQILEMNKAGFLNGHTPFSALLAFTTLLLAAGTQSAYIALSNESSANESTVPGQDVNHQYSKSIDFERDFRAYVNQYITSDISYFSFLRPINELQIAQLFSRFPAYHTAFKSCNVGSKTDSWCCNCPKCLFTWVALSPFVEQQKLTAIFGKNLFEQTALLPDLEALSGAIPLKPFECVGTTSEVLAALKASQKTPSKDAALLSAFEARNPGWIEHAPALTSFLDEYNNDHFVPDDFLTILQSALHA